MNRFLAVTLFVIGPFLAPTLVAQSAVGNHLTMNQWVQLTDDGALSGRIVRTQGDGAVKGIHVVMLARDGEVLRATSNAAGEFTIPAVKRGVYAMTARGKNVFACSAMHVISAEDNAGKFPTVAEVSVGEVDYTTVNTAVIRYLPPRAVTGNVSMQTANFGQLAERVCGNELFRVALTAGALKGRIHLAGPDLHGAEGTNVFILKDGIEIHRVITDQAGRFLIEQIEPGHYSLLAVGAGGVGLLGFELVDAAAASRRVAAADGATEKLVVNQNPVEFSDELAMQVAPMPEVVGAVEEVLVQEEGDEPDDIEDPESIAMDEIPMEGFGSPIPGGGFAPGGGGSIGGGGGGGGGGLGGIAALAGLAGVAAASSNNSGSGVIVASPSIPN